MIGKKNQKCIYLITKYVKEFIHTQIYKIKLEPISLKIHEISVFDKKTMKSILYLLALYLLSNNIKFL